MRIIVVTGAASGIGKATAEYLRSSGARVIGVDLENTDVIADLSTPQGRKEMIESVSSLAPDGIDGVVAAAGVCPPVSPDQIISVNYFGAIATLEGFQPHLANSPAPRAVAVVSTAALMECRDDLVEACLSGDEEAARKIALECGETSYTASKRALGLWLRRAAAETSWAGAGITLNAVAPGTVRTPMTIPLLETEEGREILSKATPIAVKDYGEPEELAEILAFLATTEGRYIIGQILYVDGGTDALLRPNLL